MERTTLQAFHNDPAIKAKYMERLKDHAAADEIIKGRYWSEGKGCAVGCTIHSDAHNAYETELGLPEWIARLEDRLFEGMPNENAKEFPVRFLEAIPVGANLDLTKAKFFHWLLVDAECGVIRHAKKDSTIKAINDVAGLYQMVIDEKPVSKEEWKSTATTAAYATAYATADAYATAAAYATTAAADAAYATAYAADADADAAYATAYAAYAAADAAYATAYAADADADADADARQQSFYRQSEKLIQLLGDAK